MFCFGFTDESAPKKAAAEIPEFVGHIRSVAAAGGEDPSLDIGIQSPDGSKALEDPGSCYELNGSDE